MKLKKYKITNLSLKLKKKIIFSKKYNCMNKIFFKIYLKFILMFQLTNKLMIMFSHFIIIYFILSNKDCNFCCKS